MIKPSYRVQRIKVGTNPHYLVRGKTIVKIVSSTRTCNPKVAGWYVKGHLFPTLRDAIIFCVYGLGA